MGGGGGGQQKDIKRECDKPRFVFPFVELDLKSTATERAWGFTIHFTKPNAATARPHSICHTCHCPSSLKAATLQTQKPSPTCVEWPCVHPPWHSKVGEQKPGAGFRNQHSNDTHTFCRSPTLCRVLISTQDIHHKPKYSATARTSQDHTPKSQTILCSRL